MKEKPVNSLQVRQMQEETRDNLPIIPDENTVYHIRRDGKTYGWVNRGWEELFYSKRLGCWTTPATTE